MRIIRIAIGAASLVYAHGSSPEPGLYLTALSGDHQIGTPGHLLPEPIVARLTDEAGNGVMDQSLVFDTYRNGVSLIDSSGIETRRVILRTNARGDATVGVRLGPETNTNRRVVRVSSTSKVRPATFSFHGQPHNHQTRNKDNVD